MQIKIQFNGQISQNIIQNIKSLKNKLSGNAYDSLFSQETLIKSKTLKSGSTKNTLKYARKFQDMIVQNITKFEVCHYRKET